MTYTPTTAVYKIAALRKRLKIIQGGSSAGKTIATLLILIDIAQSREGLLISVVSESFPHLKRGAMRDFINIMTAHKYFNDARWNKTDAIYTFETGSKIEFFSADQPEKSRGPRRDILFINECNNIPYETYTQLAIRTNESIYLDYNPVAEFWVHTEVIPHQPHDFIILTYKDNESLSAAIVRELESRRANKNWWAVYGLGQLGEVEGKVYKGWQFVDELPFGSRLIRRGLDFGYTNDPAALIDVYECNGGYILDEQLYQKGMSNKAIADLVKNLEDPQTLIIADSAEPKSIDELKLYGLNIIPANKGQGSIMQGIGYVQSQSIAVTTRSTRTIAEYRGYMFLTDRDGKTLNVPQDFNNHAMDAMRYAMEAARPPVVHASHKPKEMLRRKHANAI